MLSHITIDNYAIIDHLEIRFGNGLNIITGETGAGKSILLGALQMVLGKKADPSKLRDRSIRAVVEATFQLKDPGMEGLFQELEMDYELETIIRREIRPDGRSRAFVNDSPVKLEKLKLLTGRLVDLHAQQDHTVLADGDFYISLLDRMGGQQERADAFTREFLHFKQLSHELLQRQAAASRSAADLDYLQFQLRELEAISLSSADGQELEEELNLLEHAGSIIEHIQGALQLLEEDQLNAIDLLGSSCEHIGQVARYSGALTSLHDRLSEARLEIGDICRDLGRLADQTDMDEERLSDLRHRSDEINRLLQKHHLSSVDELIDLQHRLSGQLMSWSDSGEEIKRLDTRLNGMHRQLLDSARELSSGRRHQMDPLRLELTEILRTIGMPHARVELRRTELSPEQMNRLGIDDLQLYFSANKGVEMQPLEKVASGGERSRLLLAIKSVIAGQMALPTMIFDEIDTGISGEVAAKTGNLLRRVAKGHQVISITHLPQIAAMGDHHFHVFKDDSADRTAARIRELSEEGKLMEVARMLSGEQPGAAALTTAKELMSA